MAKQLIIWPVQASSGSSVTAFLLDGVSTDVSRDTVTPGNSDPLPTIQLDSSGNPVSGNIEGYGDYTEVSTLGRLTLQPLHGQRYGMDVVSRGFAFITTDTVEAGSTTTVLNAAAHPAKPGDCLRFLDFTSLRLYEVHVQSTTANTIVLAGTLPFAPTTTESFAISRPISPQYDETGKQVVKIDPPNGGFATEATLLVVSGKLTFTPVGLATLDFTGTPVTSAAYVTLAASVSATKKVQIFMSQGEPLLLAFGAPASEVDQIYVIPGGNGVIDLTIPAATRVSLKAVSATANTGYILVNFLG